ncbi:hypothetical protein ACIQ7D_37445 [Streptomyces sp. NPDC096310]|uniref:hypothetical protein n=1 Tax=Streptomyces sp. NPDC096310 TaxID=3366082 RepID=UPI0037FC4DC2
MGGSLRVAKEMLTAQISARLAAESTERIVALAAGADQAEEGEVGERALLPFPRHLEVISFGRLGIL